MDFLALPLVIATGAVFVIVVAVIISFAALHWNARIDVPAAMNLIYGKTRDSFSLKNRSVMKVKPDGKIDFKSYIK
ncbi:hypothetical protein HGB24_02070 [Candidatus Saccharibacteria bacterium]|nr:hypothetical protein [Candidatus Saccharibacteria bacterium]